MIRIYIVTVQNEENDEMIDICILAESEAKATESALEGMGGFKLSSVTIPAMRNGGIIAVWNHYYNVSVGELQNA